MAWFVLIVAGLFEVGWAVGLKYTEGFTRLWPSIGTVVFMIASLGLLGLALRTLPLGTAYAIWTGVGRLGPRCSAWRSSMRRPIRSGLAASA